MYAVNGRSNREASAHLVDERKDGDEGCIVCRVDLSAKEVDVPTAVFIAVKDQLLEWLPRHPPVSRSRDLHVAGPVGGRVGAGVKEELVAECDERKRFANALFF